MKTRKELSLQLSRTEGECCGVGGPLIDRLVTAFPLLTAFLVIKCNVLSCIYL